MDGVAPEYADWRIPCEECGKGAFYVGLNEEKEVEEYECDDGHITERDMI